MQLLRCFPLCQPELPSEPVLLQVPEPLPEPVLLQVLEPVPVLAPLLVKWVAWQNLRA